MLTRIRIEVEGEDSAAATEAALTKYEHALQITEAQRHGIGVIIEPGDERAPMFARDGWKQSVVDRGFYNEELGREVTDEVIEFDPSLPGYKGRRVVQFRRIDTRSSAARESLSTASVSFAAPDKAAA